DPQRDAWVVVDGAIIREVGQGNAPRAERTLDLGGAWLLPGLWDVHTHLRSTTWTGREPAQTFAETVLEYGRNAMDALLAGVTSLRVVGVAGGGGTPAGGRDPPDLGAPRPLAFCSAAG